MPDALPGAVLFACNLNRARSPMAEGLMRRLCGDRVFVDSCGLEGGGEPDPFAAEVMGELGVVLGRRPGKTFEDLSDGSFDVIIALTAEAHARALEFARRRAVDVEFWPTPDPTLADGARAARLDAYRAVRDALDARIRARFGNPSTSST